MNILIYTANINAGNDIKMNDELKKLSAPAALSLTNALSICSSLSYEIVTIKTINISVKLQLVYIKTNNGVSVSLQTRLLDAYMCIFT